MKKKIEYEGKKWTVVSDHTTATVNCTRVNDGVARNRITILEGTPEQVKKKMEEFGTKNVTILYSWNIKTLCRETLGTSGMPKDRETVALQAAGIDGEGKTFSPDDPEQSIENKELVEQVSTKDKVKKAVSTVKKWSITTYALAAALVLAIITAIIAWGHVFFKR